MNLKIKTRQPIEESKAQFKLGSPKNSLLVAPLKPQKTFSQSSKTKAPASKPVSLGSPTAKGILSPPKVNQIDRLVIESAIHDTLYIDIKEIEKGICIELTSEFEEEGDCTVTLNLESMEVERNKVKHTFPMPKLYVTSKYIKLPVREFSSKMFTVCAYSLKGKLRQQSVTNKYPDSVFAQRSNIITEVDPIGQVGQAERIRRRKFQGKDWTLKASRSAELLRQLCSPKQSNKQQNGLKPLVRQQLKVLNMTSSPNLEGRQTAKTIKQNKFFLRNPETTQLTRVRSGNLLVKHNKSATSIVQIGSPRNAIQRGTKLDTTTVKKSQNNRTRIQPAAVENAETKSHMQTTKSPKLSLGIGANKCFPATGIKKRVGVAKKLEYQLPKIVITNTQQDTSIEKNPI